MSIVLALEARSLIARSIPYSRRSTPIFRFAFANNFSFVGAQLATSGLRSMATMKAVIWTANGGPETLKVETRPVPKPKDGWILIKVKAFGLNRSELFTRQGASPGVPHGRILGIEAVGIVEEAPGNEFKKGDRVATAMGGMGRVFDGGYAEYTCELILVS